MKAAYNLESFFYKQISTFNLETSQMTNQRMYFFKKAGTLDAG